MKTSGPNPVLRGYPELVREVGGHPDARLRQAGIDPAELKRLTAFM